MNRFIILIYFFIVLIIYTLMNIFVYLQISKIFNFSYDDKKYLLIILIICELSFILWEIMRKFYHLAILNLIEYFYLGIISISFSVLLVFYFITELFPENVRMLNIISFIIIFILILISIYNGLKIPMVKNINIRYENLPEILENFTIVQLSDLHLGDFASKKRINEIIDKTNELKADIVVITGDLIDRDVCKIDNICTPFLELKTKYGIFAVSGNHDIYTGYKLFLSWAKDNNIKVLDNDLIQLNDDLEIAGIKDNEYNSIFRDNKIKKIFNNFSNKKFTIFLSHRPTNFKIVSENGVNLQLSGHTHKGQIPPINILIYLLYKYPYGLYKLNNSYIYTTSGTETWGPPMRLFSRNEIVKIILQKG